MPPLKEKGAEGVVEKIRAMTGELKGTMSRTGFAKLSDIDDSVIWTL